MNKKNLMAGSLISRIYFSEGFVFFAESMTRINNSPNILITQFFDFEKLHNILSIT